MSRSKQNYLSQRTVNFKILEILLPHLKNKSFIDVGAEKGAFTLFLSSHQFSGLLFEPLPNLALELNKIEDKTQCTFFPYAIDYKDRTADFYIACDQNGKIIESFSSLHPLDQGQDICHKKIGEVTCRSIDSLMRDGHLAKNIGLIHIDTEGNDLNVLKGMTEIKPEVLVCEYFMPGIYTGWELTHPLGLIEAAKKMGFKHYIVIRRINEFESVSVDDIVFFDKQWGNLIFLNESIFSTISPKLNAIIAKTTKELFSNFLSYIEVLRNENKLQSEFIKQLHNKIKQSKNSYKIKKIEAIEQRLDKIEADHNKAHKEYDLINQARLEVIAEQKKALAAYRLSHLSQKIKVFFRPHLGLLYQYNPRHLFIPKRYKIIPDLKKIPIISIVTPSFNHGNFLERTILSVLEQKYPSLEYIIQDGGSKDNTQDIIERYQSSLKHAESRKDKGQSHAINLGFQHATGEIMAYLNSDDILLPGTLHYVVNYFNTHPEVDVVYGHRVIINEDDEEIGRWILPLHDQNALKWVDYIPQETLFWRKSIWDKVGGSVDESFKFAMDWDLLLRFQKEGAKFARLPRFMGAFRVHSNQKTSAQIAEVGMKEMERLRIRCHGRKVYHLEIRKNTFFYIAKHLLLHKLYRLGILRY